MMETINAIEPIGFYELARASHIKRWHIVNTAQQQNLAEHQYNVAVIGLELHKLLCREDPHPNFILGLLFHDVAEIRYGDIPTPGKQFISNIVDTNPNELPLFERMDHTLVPRTPYSPSYTGQTEKSFQIIKMADTIEAAWWIRENGVGAHAKVVADKCWAAVVKLTTLNGWHIEVNEVLQKLGMPYVSKDISILPP